MADSLREAAEQIVLEHEAVLLGSGRFTDRATAVDLVEASLRKLFPLSAPDPVAEAREIIEYLVGFAEEYHVKHGAKARAWLERNGDVK